MKCLFFTTALAFTLSFVPPGHTAEVLLVDWDGTGVSEPIPLAIRNHQGSISAEVHTFPLAPERAWLPEGIDFPPEKSSHFLMAISSSAGTGPVVPHLLRLEPRGSQGTLTILVQGSEDLPPQMRGILAFPKDHFLEGADRAQRPVHFDAMSRLAFRGILDGRAPVARWLVRDGETWWISEETLTPQENYNESEERELVDPEASRWAQYDPGADPLGETPGEFQTHQFRDVTALGLFWDSYGADQIIGGTSFTRVAMDSFQAQALSGR